VQPVVPVLEDDRYVFRAGRTRLEVDAGLGGRVTRFSLDGRNVLTGPEVVAAGPDALPNMFGSTFWTSPQSDWGWPPETELDSDGHEARVEGDALQLERPPGSRTGYGVRKRFRLDAATGVVHIDYELVNHQASAPAAPWEISRVAKRGLVFFPSGSAPLAASSLSSQTIDGVAWVDIPGAPSSDSKLFQDGSEGWLAHAEGDLVFIKLFENVPVPEQATGEAEVEVFVSGSFDYVEIEQQGRYAEIPTGEGVGWSVRWLLLERPRALPLTLGSAALVAWVRAQIAELEP
jgi:hypothetical protein